MDSVTKLLASGIRDPPKSQANMAVFPVLKMRSLMLQGPYHYTVSQSPCPARGL